jgi:RHS repeat-associated protein
VLDTPKQEGSNTGGVSDGSRIQPPTISLPKGGGAIWGLGEKFAANPVTGTGSLSVPIFTSPGRSGFGPQLSLSYDSGSGNGPFGFGWSLSLPAITRKTDKGLPQYKDAEESDVFIFSGAEDLVPLLVKSGNKWIKETPQLRTRNGKTYQIRRYRPRIEGLFARIEHWTNNTDPKDIFWRSISKNNITTTYGRSENSRIADPADTTHVFSWLISESYDDKGNVVIYEYVPEDSIGINLSQVHEKNRTDVSRSANRYLKRIKYGNKTSRLVEPDLSRLDWLFEVVFDYDEGHYEALSLDSKNRQFVTASSGKSRGWPVRQDPFSSYRAGFEVRTYRLCRRALMFHHFPDELGIKDYLVRSTAFAYQESPIASFITGITQSGYVRQNDSTYLEKSLPSLEFEYSTAEIQEEVREISMESLKNLPYGLDGAQYQWVDLDGEGLSGILTEQADAWFYKPNLGDGKFGPLQPVAVKPSLANLNSGRQQLLDLAGDGQLDLVELGGPTPGFYERTADRNWEKFTPFVSLPNLIWSDPNLKFVDLTGDGHTDILITDDGALAWYPSLAEAGFGPGEKTSQYLDEEKGPRLVFADGTQSIYLADFSGDGLTDLVRIRNGEVCYWPNLGYGRFGAKVTMDHAPWFDNNDLFDQKRIRLADIDGSGTTDIVYLGRDGIDIYRNQSGNSWSPPQKLERFPAVDNMASVMAVDLLGNGTAYLVWSSSLPGDTRRPMHYIDLMGGQKPHLLVRMKNNMGAETHMQYVSSTKFYLKDRESGKPWITRLPFPVHVVESVETYDRISRNRFVTRYAYHHGYFDGVEREFRGFGMVEQWDTEETGNVPPDVTSSEVTNLDLASFVPPVLTKTWFHTGVYLGRDHVSDFFAGLLDGEDVGEYYRETGLSDQNARKLLLDDTLLPDGLTAGEEREACRALKGSILRQEIYAQDGSAKAGFPYSVSERNYTIEKVQGREINPVAVFFTHARETLNYYYERNPLDPRVQHELVLEVDEFGNVLKSAAVGYGRRQGQSLLQGDDKKKQEQTLITYTENDVTKSIEEADVHRTPLPCETRTYELTGIKPDNNAARFSFEEWARNAFSLPASATEIPYEQTADYTTPQKRLIEQVRTFYRKNDLTDLLSLGTVESQALPGENYRLAFTPGLLAQVYRRDNENLLPDPAGILGGNGSDQGGYVDLDKDNRWWIPSGRLFYHDDKNATAEQELTQAEDHFFLPRRFRDPFDNETRVTYDIHDLLAEKTTDALNNTIQAGNDYRVLQPKLVTDPNGNHSKAAFDALGLVAGTAVVGKNGEGDSLTDFRADLDEDELDQFSAVPRLSDPLAQPSPAAPLLQQATTRIIYDVTRYVRTGEPVYAATLARETHVSELSLGQTSAIQVSFSYSDGFDREIQKKVQAEPGPVPSRDGNDNIVVGTDGQPQMTPGDFSPRWVGSGWTVFNNKGKPVRKYEPFFTDTHRFEFDARIGVSPVLFYDPVERVVVTLHPNHTYEKVVFDSWHQKTYDVNDTVAANATETGDPRTDADINGYVAEYFKTQPNTWQTWHQERITGAKGTQEKSAAEKAATHANTPTVTHFDTLGRIFLTIANNRFERNGAVVNEAYETRIGLDIEGNQREVIDAKDRAVMRYDYYMAGPEKDKDKGTATNRIHQASMDAGERWTLNDVLGKPIRAWDSRGHTFSTEYDQLRRPTDSYLLKGAGLLKLIGRTIYGETQSSPEAGNLRGKVFQIFDQAGIVTNDSYDFKGNLLRSQRQLACEYKTTLDYWSLTTVPMESATYISQTTYDALNRPRELTAPDNSAIRPIYNEANLLNAIKANLRGEVAETAFVTNIDYDAKGQRMLIAYGNGVKTSYEYDPFTFRLNHLQTVRGEESLQDLFYTYDPVGNITHIQDDAQQTIYFSGQVVEPQCDYVYDAIYRLINATGREHIGQLAQPQTTWNDEFRINLPQPGDGQAMRNYIEQYLYDAVGNFEKFIHQAANGNWTRAYTYNKTSQLEVGKVNNRLSSTVIGSITEDYGYDGSAGLHGNITTMPNLPLMQWDYRDQLQATSQQVVNNGGTPETTYYVYDAGGRRVRKVTERQATAGITPTRMKERIYLGGFEIYREHGGDGNAVELERETLHVMDDKQRIALVETRMQGNEPGVPEQLIRYQFSNHLGSASLELDDQALIISYEEYYPYGSTSYQAVSSRTETPKRYRYTGKERDEESGLYYYGARYYADWLCRFVNVDPLQFKYPHYTPYQYAGNKPVTFIDLDGKQEKKPEGTSTIDLIYWWSGGDAAFYSQPSISTSGYTITNCKNCVMQPSPFLKDPYNRYVNTDSAFFANDKEITPENVVNILLGNLIKGTGPENYVFPKNGAISSEMAKSEIFLNAFRKWSNSNIDAIATYSSNLTEYNEFEKFSWKEQINCGIKNMGITNIENLVGGAQVTIKPIDANTIDVTIFNVTSITSGDLTKHVTTIPESKVRNPKDSSPQPYTNISQTFSFTIQLPYQVRESASEIYDFRKQNNFDPAIFKH